MALSVSDARANEADEAITFTVSLNRKVVGMVPGGSRPDSAAQRTEQEMPIG